MHRYNTMPLLNQYSKLASQWTQSTIHLKQFQSHFPRTQFEIQSTTLKSLPIKQTAFSPTHTYIHAYIPNCTHIHIHTQMKTYMNVWRAKRSWDLQDGVLGAVFDSGVSAASLGGESAEIWFQDRHESHLWSSLSLTGLVKMEWISFPGLVDRWLWNQETRRDHQDRREWESQRDSESLARSLDLERHREREREREREIRCNTCGTHEDVKEVVGPTIRRYLDFGQGRWFCICLNYKKQPEV